MTDILLRKWDVESNAELEAEMKVIQKQMVEAKKKNVLTYRRN
tara:strand:+ start:337 stop:465 length:129 start_codon:yes stop_codon:yes gene_type:complete